MDQIENTQNATFVPFTMDCSKISSKLLKRKRRNEMRFSFMQTIGQNPVWVFRCSNENDAKRNNNNKKLRRKGHRMKTKPSEGKKNNNKWRNMGTICVIRVRKMRITWNGRHMHKRRHDFFCCYLAAVVKRLQNKHKQAQKTQIDTAMAME